MIINLNHAFIYLHHFHSHDILENCLKSIYLYLDAVRVFGWQNVGLIFHPFARYGVLHLQNSMNYGETYRPIIDRIQKNPNLKLVIYQTMFLRSTIVLDENFIKSMALEYTNKMFKIKYGVFHDEIFKGLLFMEGETWKHARKFFSNLFHFQQLKKRQQIITNTVHSEIKQLDTKIVDLYQIGSTIAGEIILRSLFGEQTQKLIINDRKIYQVVTDLYAQHIILTRRILCGIRFLLFGVVNRDCFWLSQQQKLYLANIDQFYAVCSEYLKSELEKFKNNQSVPPFLQAYFKARFSYSNIFEQIIHQIFIFLFAGQDTTGTTIAMCLYYLAEHPTLQNQLREQLQNFDSNNLHTNKKLNNFIMESIRRNTRVIFTVPRTVQEVFKIGGYNLRKDEIILSGIGLNMRNAKFFDKPEDFNPLRFQTVAQNQQSAFIPFFTGPRNCIGQHMAMMQIRSTLYSILRQYKLVRTATELRMFSGIILNKPLDSRLVKFIKI